MKTVKILVSILNESGGAEINREFTAKVITELNKSYSVLLHDEFKDEVEELAASTLNRKTF